MIPIIRLCLLPVLLTLSSCYAVSGYVIGKQVDDALHTDKYADKYASKGLEMDLKATRKNGKTSDYNPSVCSDFREELSCNEKTGVCTCAIPKQDSCKPYAQC